MALNDKARHNTEEAFGKGKEAAGKVTGDEKLENEGRADQASAKVKKAGDAVKDAFHKVADK